MNSRGIAMACVFLAVAITALPADDQVAEALPADMAPETELYTERLHKEATKEVASLMEAGKTKDACASLADQMKKEVEDGQKNTQRLVDRMDVGKNCHTAGLAAYNSAKSAQSNAKTNYDAAKKTAKKAAKAPIKFSPFTPSQVKTSGCLDVSKDPAYIKAKKATASASKKSTLAKGKYDNSRKATSDALKAHQKAKVACACRAQKNFKVATKATNDFNSAKNAKAWTKAHHMKCVLSGKPANKCAVPRVPRVTAPRMPSWVSRTRCKGVNSPSPSPSPPKRPSPSPPKSSNSKFSLTGVGKGIKYASDKWALTTSDTIYATSKGAWKLIPGKLKQLAQSPSGSSRIWGVNKNNDIFTRAGVGGGWQHISGKLKQISVSGDRVWGVNPGDAIFTRAGVGGNWKHIGGKLKQISCSQSGNRVWGVTKNGDIYTRPGVGGSWKKIGGRLKQISVSGDRVWGVNRSDNIYTRAGVGGGWKKIGGRLKQISVIGDRVWGINSAGKVFTRNGVKGSWVHVTGGSSRRPTGGSSRRPMCGSSGCGGGGNLSCKVTTKGSNHAGVIKPSFPGGGYQLVGGGLNNHYRSFNHLSAFEEAFPHGNHFQCDTGFGAGRLTCYAMYCKKSGLRCRTTKSSRQRKSGSQTVNAPRGYTMTGGGLYNHYRHFNKRAHFERSYPNGNGWIGDMGAGWGDYTVTVRSCKGLSCTTRHSGVGNSKVVRCPSGYKVTSCGSHQMNGWGKLGALENYSFHGNGCHCDMGFGSGKMRCYARCCK